ncbi:helix-turn-helix domain-containing protein [Ruminococcaceae bacterium OttesenSCG-928-I18]|nr:helix-turn-helix domain-containing protein [Ruminococcaceae bacterium OttesenSCG-928-I18]
MNGMTAKDAAEKWGITPRQVQLLCSQGRIPGAVRFGHAWLIPADAEKPQDGRRRKKENDKGRKHDYR